MPSAENFLIIGPAWVGDMVMAQSLFAALKSRHPQSTIDVLAPRWTLPLLRFMPDVRRAIEQPLGHGELGLSTRRRLGNALRINWAEFVPPSRLDYILGNPPFVGSKMQSEAQRAQVARIAVGGGRGGSGTGAEALRVCG